MSQTLPHLSADLAQTNPVTDELGYAPFARNIAKGICNMSPVDGITIGVTGNWGTGKTTMINFIRHYVKEIDNSIEQIDFNPWWFAGHEDIVRNLFRILALRCKPDSETGRKLVGLLAEYADAIDTVPVELKPGAFGFSFDLKKLAQKSAESFRKAKPIPELKGEIATLLREFKERFLIIVDDVDRLSASEIRDLFRAIKAVGDLPNVIYLLAVDKEVVSESLKAYFPGRGDAYLSKIIQVPFDLPTISADGIMRMFLKGLNEILTSLSVEPRDEDRFWTVYRTGMRHMLQTPRDLARLLNTLYVTLPGVVGEVDITDFVALEACRLFESRLYHRIRTNKDYFAGDVSSSLRADPESKTFHEHTVETGKAWQKEFLTVLFPQAGHWLGDNAYGTAFLADWRRDLRVCSPDIFDVYFRFTLPSDEISAESLNKFIREVNHGKCKELIADAAAGTDAKQKNQLWSLIERLEDHSAELNEKGHTTLFLDVLEVWESYTDVPGIKIRTLFGSQNDIFIVRRLFNSLTGIAAENRMKILEAAVHRGFGLKYLVRLTANVGSAYGQFNDGRPANPKMAVLSNSEFDRLVQTICAKLELVIKEGQYTEDLIPKAVLFLSEASPDKMPDMCTSLLNTPEGRVGLIQYGAQETLAYSGANKPRRFSFNLPLLEKMADLPKLAYQLESDKKTAKLSQRSLELIDCFVDALKRRASNIDEDD